MKSQLADAKEMAEKSQALQEASGASVARLEETQEAYKGSVVALQDRLEASVSEINRGNAIIQKLQGQYRALRSKAKLKSEVIKQQVRASHGCAMSNGRRFKCLEPSVAGVFGSAIPSSLHFTVPLREFLGIRGDLYTKRRNVLTATLVVAHSAHPFHPHQNTLLI